MSIPETIAYARQLDATDPLGSFRQAFALDQDGEDLIYLDGNSLGRLPRQAIAIAEHVVKREWGQRLIRSWNEGWYRANHRIGAKIAHLVGAGEDEVIVSDSTSVNLFKLTLAALRARRNRRTVLTDDLNFPSDLYVTQKAVSLLSDHHRLDIIRSDDGILGPVDALLGQLADQTALLTLSHTSYRSGYTYDMEQLTRAAHRAGALVLWDLSHSVGAMPIHLGDYGVDMAVGCTYKYLNGGPGAPAFIYVRRDILSSLDNPIGGWFGHSQPFAFAEEYVPGEDMRRFLVGTPPIASLSLIEPGLDILLEAGLDRVRAKSVHQTSYLIELWHQLLAPLGMQLRSPIRSIERGSHVSFGHPYAWGIVQALIRERSILPDFRAPDHIRLGLAPLYTTFEEILRAVRAIREIVEDQRYLHYQNEQAEVT